MLISWFDGLDPVGLEIGDLLVGLPGSGGFGPGAAHLGAPWFALGAGGVTDATGLGSLELTAPTTPGMIGAEVGLQAALASGPVLGAHAARIRFVR